MPGVIPEPSVIIPTAPTPIVAEPVGATPNTPTPVTHTPASISQVAVGTLVQTQTATIPANVGKLTVTLSSGFVGADVSQISCKRLAGTGTLEVTHWDITSTTVTAYFNSQALDSSHFQLVILLVKINAT